MKKYLHAFILLLIVFYLFSCAPVIRKDLMDVAIRDISFSEVKKNPELYKAKLFVLGGIIINTKVTSEGSLVEALYSPVDSRGFLKGIGKIHIRFLALFPKESGILDPMIFKPEREITLAAEFIGTKKGRIDDMDYVYPLFRIKEVYLWEERKEYYLTPSFYDSYPYWWGHPFWWNHSYWGWRYHTPPPYWW
jgi:outer membrane lipoprotein